MKPTDIKLYGSGALSDGGTQNSPERDFGGFRSSREILNQKDATAPAAISGVTIDFASVANANANGTLTYTLGTNSLQWTANGDTIGPAVAFTADATKILYSNDETKFIQVTVDFSALPVGAAGPDTITISESSTTLNNIFGDVQSADIVEGFIEHRGFFLKNTHLIEPIDDVKIYISLNTAYANDFIEFVFEEPSTRSGGSIQTIVNEEAIPANVGTLVSGASLWNRVTTEPTAILMPGVQTLLAGQHIGMWYRRAVSANSASFANNIFQITVVGEVPSLEN